MRQTKSEWLQEDVGLKRHVSGYLIKRLIDPALSEACGISGEQYDGTKYLIPSLSREQLSDLMSLTAPENALAMICGRGIKTKEEAVAFLEDNDLHSLLADNKESVAEAISRRADLSKLIDMIAYKRVALWRYPMECSWADLSQLYSTSLRDSEVDFRLADGDSSWEYVKSIGISNVSSYGDELLSLEGIFTPQEVKTLVARANYPMKNPADTYPLKSTKRDRLTALISIAKKLGVAATVELEVPGVFNMLKSAIGREPEAAACKFVDDFIKLSNASGLDDRKWNYGSAHSYYEEGFTVEETLRFITDGISLPRAEEIRDEGIAVPISGGWL